MTDIQYFGHSCFRLRGRDGVVLTDPFDRSTGLDIGRPTANIVTVSHKHADHANVDAVRPMKEDLFTLDGPGEYEIGGILITGVRCYHDKDEGQELGKNTVYVINIDDVTFCHLGDLGHELTTKQINEIGAVDILFIPVGGKETIGPAEAANVIGQLEPRIVIPMHYALNEKHHSHTELESLDKFIHELGLKDVSAEAKFSISVSNLPAEGGETRVVVMKPSG